MCIRDRGEVQFQSFQLLGQRCCIVLAGIQVFPYQLRETAQITTGRFPVLLVDMVLNTVQRIEDEVAGPILGYTLLFQL